MAEKCKHCGACKECGALPNRGVIYVYPWHWVQPNVYVSNPSVTWNNASAVTSGYTSTGTASATWSA